MIRRSIFIFQLSLLVIMTTLAACATTTKAKPAPASSQAADAQKQQRDKDTASKSTQSAAALADINEDAPALLSWSDFTQDHSLRCMSQPDERSQPETREVAGQKFRIEGSLLSLQSPIQYPIRIGVVSAIKDAEDDTLQNLDHAFAEFKKSGVQLIVANGDLALQQFDLESVMNKLGDSGLPVFVVVGNSESRSAFNRAFRKAETRHPNLFNLNWNRHVAYGPVDFVSLPGYYSSAFLGQNSGCLYRPRDVEALDNLCADLRAKNRRLVLISHGPPRSHGKAAIDYAFEAGNVGDSAMTRLIEDYDIGLGLFGHILEAGGRGSQDLRLGKAAHTGKLYQKLYVNAGSASATPWGMHNKKESHGMVLIVTIEEAGASYRVIRLR